MVSASGAATARTGNGSAPSVGLNGGASARRVDSLGFGGGGEIGVAFRGGAESQSDMSRRHGDMIVKVKRTQMR